MISTITPYRSQRRQGSDGFGALVRSEWTKFRTVPAWCMAVILATAGALGFCLFLSSNGANCSGTSPGGRPICNGQAPPSGPGGERVADSYYFVHQPQQGNGSITVQVTSLTNATHGFLPDNVAVSDTTQPWAKAGLIVTTSTKQGAAYGAVMVTANHGVRMQYDYTHDIAGPAVTVSSTSAEWLRLARSGDTLTGYASADGTHWTKIATAVLSGLPQRVQTGMFVASPDSAEPHQAGMVTAASGVFEHASLHGGQGDGEWRGTQVGAGHPRGQTGFFEPGQQPRPGQFSQSGGTFNVTGSGDIGPYLPPDDALGNSLLGMIIALIVVITVVALYITAEYRRGLIRTTFSASPRRGRVLAAKAIVGAVGAFAIGLVAAAIALPLTERLLRSHSYAPPWWLTGAGLTSGTGLRIVLGTGALFAIAAVLTIAIGAIARRSAAAVTAAFVVVVLPIILMFTLPESAAQWVQKYTPAAALGIQSSIPHYQQVACYATKGCFPLSPWAGLGVFALYAAASSGIAFALLRQRDA